MEEYLNIVESVMTGGNYRQNRTDVDTLSSFSQHYAVDLQDGVPLLTTKQMDGGRWDALVSELLWYLSGDETIQELKEHSNMWEPWADENGNIDSSIGRFWRRFPKPASKLSGEAWTEGTEPWTNADGTIDQLQYVISELQENPTTRRLVVSAWHPANATVSSLPPCEYSFTLNVQDGRLNMHLTQRSADLAVGVPFDIARHAILTKIIAQQTGFNPGRFSHTMVDTHIYCGSGARGRFYRDQLDEFQYRVQTASNPEDYEAIIEWINETAPSNDDYDHIPGLLIQLSRQPLERPTIAVTEKPIDDLDSDDFTLLEYESHSPIEFKVVE